MADVSVIPGIFAQARLVGWLRWRLLVNTLRTGRAQLDLFARALAGVVLVLVALGAGVGLGFMGYFFVAYDRASQLVYVAWGLFFAWQFFSLLAAATTVEFDFRDLLRYPLRFSTFSALHIFYGLFDPAAIVALTGLVALGIGMSVAQPSLTVWVLLVLGAFAAVNLLLNRLLLSWLERILAQRRGRETLLLLMVLLIVGVQILGVAGERWFEAGGIHLRWVTYLAYALPPGLVGLALEFAVRGDPGPVLALVVALAIYAKLVLVHLLRRLRALHSGEELSEGESPRPVPARFTAAERHRAAPRHELIRFSGPVAAIVEKELRYFLRIGPMLLTLILPPLLIGLFALIWTQADKLPPVFARSPDLMFPTAIAYLFLILSPHSYNSFSYDRHGVQLLLAAPVRFRDVLLGKNLALAALVVLEALLLLVLVAVLIHPPGATMVAAAFLALLFALLASLSIGNWLSLRFPRAMDLERFRGQQSGVTILVSLVMQAVIFGLAGFVLFLTVLFNALGTAVLLFACLAGLILPVYRWVLAATDRLAAENREVLVAELCK